MQKIDRRVWEIKSRLSTLSRERLTLLGTEAAALATREDGDETLEAMRKKKVPPSNTLSQTSVDARALSDASDIDMFL